jgi:hypothetical protein
MVLGYNCFIQGAYTIMLCENFKTKNMITATDYNYPLGIPGGYFNGKAVPTFPDYLIDYHVHFMRYLYYLCIMNAEGEYPIEISIDDILRAFDECKSKKCKDCTPRIKKILICEAPPINPLNYFYNPYSPWTIAGRPGRGGTAYAGAIQTALFPGIAFPTKIAFLQECAREGFILLDLFPYAIPYAGRGTIAYQNACISAFGFGAAPYPQNILNTLNFLICSLQKTIAFGFALKSSGEIIITDPGSVANFNAWCLANGITLNPPGPLEQNRIVPPPVAGASDYLRVCGRQGLFGPCPILLNLAGF